MPKKFSGWKVPPPAGAPASLISAPDEIVLIIRYSELAKYIDVTEKDGKPIGAMQGASVMLQLAMQFLGALAQERSMIAGKENINDGDKKED